MSAPAVPSPVLTSDIVAKAWIKSIPAVVALADVPPVGLTLPAGDPPSWASTGFITVRTVGGSPHPDFALRSPMLMVQTFAIKARSTKVPPWHTASRLAEYVLAACYDEALTHATLDIVEGGRQYPQATIIEIEAPATEPRPITDDPANFARYTFDFGMRWVAA